MIFFFLLLVSYTILLSFIESVNWKIIHKLCKKLWHLRWTWLHIIYVFFLFCTRWNWKIIIYKILYARSFGDFNFNFMGGGGESFKQTIKHMIYQFSWNILPSLYSWSFLSAVANWINSKIFRLGFVAFTDWVWMYLIFWKIRIIFQMKKTLIWISISFIFLLRR